MTEIRTAPSTLEWVTERAKCSLDSVFLALKEEVERDLNAQNALEGHRQLTFRNSSDRFEIYRRSDRGMESVAFVLRRDKIDVVDVNGTLIFDATLTLNDLGECKLKVDNQERELWQVRRRALEEFFFGPSNLAPHMR